nr:Pili retraction protein pilT [uncultured bacterium]
MLEICRTGFIEGDLIVPSFVLDELRHIADSADSLRRARGRRGLDMLRKMQEELGGSLRVEDVRQEDDAEVDVRLLRLAVALGGAVMTNDYNLNKVAGVAGVPVLNVNELASALRPAVLPGEEMPVRIVREGKEPGQGVAYLDDGTMVVVENGRRRVGETLDAEVTTVLQTSAGRMIFARVKDRETQAV